MNKTNFSFKFIIILAIVVLVCVGLVEFVMWSKVAIAPYIKG